MDPKRRQDFVFYTDQEIHARTLSRRGWNGKASEGSPVSRVDIPLKRIHFDRQMLQVAFHSGTRDAIRSDHGIFQCLPSVD